MFDPRSLDLAFTLLGCFALLGLWVGAAAVLPWTEDELDEVEEGLTALRSVRPSAVLAPIALRRAAPR